MAGGGPRLRDSPGDDTHQRHFSKQEIMLGGMCQCQTNAYGDLQPHSKTLLVKFP